MNWTLFLQVMTTLCVAMIGGWMGHRFSSRRDLANERRKLRVAYLLEAYRKLEAASNRSDQAQSWTQFESAIADIQLLGSPRQVSQARKFAHEMANDHTSKLDDLIFDLRQSLRSELKLEPVSDSIVYLRFARNQENRDKCSHPSEPQLPHDS